MIPQGWIAPLYDDERDGPEARGARRDDRIALDVELDEGDLLRLGLGEFRAVARLHDQLAAERLADGTDRLGRFLRDEAAFDGVRGGQKAVDLSRDDGREL